MTSATDQSPAIEGSLQRKVLSAFIEGPSTGATIMQKLKLRSPGTIYPVLKSLRHKGLIHQVAQQGRRKLHALTEKGIHELKQNMLGLNRPYFTYHIDDTYVTPFVNQLQKLLQLNPNMRVLSTLNYKPYREWLSAYDVTYLDVFEPPAAQYHLILSGMLGTILSFGWMKNEFTQYFEQIVNSLLPAGAFITLEVEQSENVFVTMFFREVLGLERVLGITQEELRDLLEHKGLHVNSIERYRGLLIGRCTKPSQ